jgi:sec-independent protein translocase protein TatB
MDFLGIGPFEIALVVLIAFIVLGPDRIPEVMRQLGKWTRQLREFTNNVTRDYGSDIQQLTGEITALQEEFRSIQREITQVATGFMTTTLPTDLNNSIAPPNTAPAAPPAEPAPEPAAKPIEPPSDPAPAQSHDDTYTI